jgi:CheY-like chemotaxis protein
MLSKLSDKTAKIAIVDNSAATRQLLSETVKSFGYSQIHGMASIKDLIQFMETDDTDLVICSLEAANEYNALNVLNLITKNADLRHLRVCIVYDEEDLYALPKAFELGAIATIAKPFTKETLKQSFAKLIEETEANNANEALVAASFLRQIFEKNADFEGWVEFEKKMLSFFPGSTGLLLTLGEALLSSGRRDEAAQVLNQAMLIDPNLADQAEIIFSKVETDGETLQSLNSASGGKFNALGLDRVVVVDPDETIQTAIKEILLEVGASEVECFSDGVSAAAYIKDNPNPQLVIQEWRIPQLSGPMFIQRIVSEGAASTPIIVLSSLVQPKDMPLIREIGVTNVVEKPFDRTEFLKCVIWTIQQERIPTEQQTLEVKIRKLLKVKDFNEAEQLIARYCSDTKTSMGRQLLINAEWDYAKKDYPAAKAKCIAALKNSIDAINAFTLLGRTLIQMRDFEGALKCLEKAQSLSPNNIERLCSIAESHAETGDLEAAKSAVDSAVDLDPDAVAVQETQVKVAIASDDLDSAKKIMNSLDALENIISYMNNKAVAFARTDRFEDSLNEYEKTVKALPDQKPELKAMVLYNNALALARASRLEEARDKLDMVLIDPPEKIKAKAWSLKARIDQALQSGAAFQLNVNQNAPVPKLPNQSENDGAEPENIVEILPNPGDIGCYMIFQQKDKDPKVDAMLKKPISFTSRVGISREETMKVTSK